MNIKKARREERKRKREKKKKDKVLEGYICSRNLNGLSQLLERAQRVLWRHCLRGNASQSSHPENKVQEKEIKRKKKRGKDDNKRDQCTFSDMIEVFC